MSPSEVLGINGIHMSKQTWVNCISAIALTALSVVAMWMLIRFIVSNLAVSQATRHSCKICESKLVKYLYFGTMLCYMLNYFCSSVRSPDPKECWHLHWLCIDAHAYSIRLREGISYHCI